MSIKDDFDRDGFVIIRDVMTQAQVDAMRRDILGVYEKRSTAAFNGSSSELRPKVLFDELPDVVKLQFNPRIVDATRRVFGDFFIINDTHVQKNNQLRGGYAGWHLDAGSNFAMSYVNKDMSRENYRQAKLGIYLQDDACPYGASISVIPGSHRAGKLRRMLLNRGLFFLENKLTQGSGFYRLFGAKSLDTELGPGDAVLFDCRLFHRSSEGRTKAPPPDQRDAVNDKLTIYWAVAGNEFSARQFVANDLHKALVLETEDREYPTDKPYSHYLKLKFPDDYPEWYVRGVKEAGLRVGQVENAKELEIARKIYAR